MSLLRYFKILTGSKGSTPEGAPTSTNIDSNTQALDVSVKGTINVDKTDLATDTLQTVGNTSLNNIDTNLGAKADAAATTDTGTFSLISLFKRSLEKLTSILTTQTDGSQKTKITDGAGVVNTKQLGTAVTTSDVGLVTQSVIHGITTGGGGGYVDVKVNPSGALTVDATISGTVPVSAVTLPLPTGAATSANQTTANNYLAALNSLTPSVFDYISLTYTLGNVTTVVYKNGGAGGTTISTLTLAYDGSGNLTSVTKT